MRAYEMVFIFHRDSESYTKGLEFVRNELQNHGAQILKEEGMGERTFAYPIKKQSYGHYVLFHVNFNPQKLQEIDKNFKLQQAILKYLFIRQD